jgi:hypothetical protein
MSSIRAANFDPLRADVERRMALSLRVIRRCGILRDHHLRGREGKFRPQDPFFPSPGWKISTPACFASEGDRFFSRRERVFSQADPFFHEREHCFSAPDY